MSVKVFPEKIGIWERLTFKGAGTLQSASGQEGTESHQQQGEFLLSPPYLMQLFLGVLSLFVSVFENRIFLCNSPGYLGTHSIDQADLELTERSACLWD